MAIAKLTGKELRAIGYPQGPIIAVVINVIAQNYRNETKEEVMELLAKILAAPDDYENDAVLGLIAGLLLAKEDPEGENIVLNSSGIEFSVFGKEHIEEGAMLQMIQAAKLPVSVAGALMPDAHAGYGLPIGGVLATDNAVIPYGVGVDIGCRMCLSIFDINPKELAEKESFFVRELGAATLFGSGGVFAKPTDHAIIDNVLFNELAILKGLQDRAWKQLGTSGSGNHFAEFGVIEVKEKDAILGVEAGRYVGFLTHSGSRALGANIANHYTKLAIGKRRLPVDAQKLAWLSLSEEEGIEYWNAMNLAGDYASACHHVIHEKIAVQLGRKPLKLVENHHNFAWKEQWNGKEVIVHRKGATPAGKNVLGIIPGSMTADGFIVKGKASIAAVNSASHGAGRKMSRTKAMTIVTDKAFKEELKKYGVKLLGGGLDESPFAYKDIHVVMQSQQSLVDIVGKFTPKIVKMDSAPHKSWGKKKKAEIIGE